MWLALGTGRTKRSASDKSFKYMGSNRSAAPRAMRMAPLAFMQASCWRNEKDPGRNIDSMRPNPNGFILLRNRETHELSLDSSVNARGIKRALNDKSKQC